MKDTSTEEELPREAGAETDAPGEDSMDDGAQAATAAAESSKKKVKDKTIKIKQSEYDRLVDEAATNKDKYVRLFAEFDNARKRMEREKMEFAKYANEEILVDLLGLFDNLERSLHYAREHKMENLTKGLEMVIKEAKEILRKYGVEPIEAEGKVFDPHRHEILMQEDNDELEEGTVLQELQKGYMMGEKVIRTTKVKVSTKSSD
ncbi:MAG: nucleotide exchange factor GrpE [Candidatus Omnitrophica bacterium]|nr:nucleotide exchange factor GrpE [Candidatus Omnitrophota bacterium]